MLDWNAAAAAAENDLAAAAAVGGVRPVEAHSDGKSFAGADVVVGKYPVGNSLKLGVSIFHQDGALVVDVVAGNLENELAAVHIAVVSVVPRQPEPGLDNAVGNCLVGNYPVGNSLKLGVLGFHWDDAVAELVVVSADVVVFVDLLPPAFCVLPQPELGPVVV